MYARAHRHTRSRSLTHAHYIRNGKTLPTETSIQILEREDFVEAMIIPRTYQTEKNPRRRVLLYLESIVAQTKPSDATLNKLMVN
jgi:hypothetical protein